VEWMRRSITLVDDAAMALLYGWKESYSTLLYHWGFLPEVGGAMIRGMSVSTPPNKQPTQQVTAVATMDGSWG